MNLSENDIEELAEEFKNSLRQANGQLTNRATTLSEIQRWTIRNNVEHPKVLERIIQNQNKRLTGKTSCLGYADQSNALGWTGRGRLRASSV